MSKIFIKIVTVSFLFMSLVRAETLQKFEISGNKRISDQTIIIFSELKIDEEITKRKLDKVIKKLYQTNFFRNINLSFSNQTLFLKVEENPIIENLQITGIKKQSLVEFIKAKRYKGLNLNLTEFAYVALQRALGKHDDSYKLSKFPEKGTPESGGG